MNAEMEKRTEEIVEIVNIELDLITAGKDVLYTEEDLRKGIRLALESREREVEELNKKNAELAAKLELYDEDRLATIAEFDARSRVLRNEVLEEVAKECDSLAKSEISEVSRRPAYIAADDSINAERHHRAIAFANAASHIRSLKSKENQ